MMSLKKLRIEYSLFTQAFFKDACRLNAEESYFFKITGKIMFVKYYDDESDFSFSYRRLKN